MSSSHIICSLFRLNQVGQMVHALKMGWMKPTKPKTEEEEEPNFYMLWKEEDEEVFFSFKLSLSLSFN